MPVTREDSRQATSLLANDLVATLGWSRVVAEEFAGREAEAQGDPCFWWMWDELPADRYEGYMLRVAEEVQQHLHDTFTDTSWPPCPMHPNHPLWLEEEDVPLVWRCPKSGAGVAPLGQLR